MTKNFKKVTFGWVTQEFVDGVCVEQEFFAGDEVRYEDDMGDPVDADTDHEKYNGFDMVQPLPVEIESVIRCGELDIDPVVDVADALDQCSRLMDKSCTYDVLGTPLFRAKNGRFYTIELCAEVLPASLTYIEEEINNLLDQYEELGDSDMQAVADIATIKDQKERVDAKMDLYNRLSGLKARLDAVKERIADEQQS